jgi:hypothetical protein
VDQTSTAHRLYTVALNAVTRQGQVVGTASTLEPTTAGTTRAQGVGCWAMAHVIDREPMKAATERQVGSMAAR